jgi:hypothetical protein
MTMKLSKTFLMGILAFTLVFGMTLAGCDNGSTSDDGGSGSGGGNSLTGSWVDARATPTEAFIFTDVVDAAVAGAKVAYYSTNLSNENTTATGNQVTIEGTSYTYTIANNVLTVTGYGVADAQGNRPNVVFNRAQGTSGSTMHGIWISNLASTNARYTLLIIRSSSANIFTSVGQNSWGESPYSLSSDANATYIKWGNNNPIAYTRTTNPDQLDITPPGGGNQLTGLITQTSW